MFSLELPWALQYNGYWIALVLAIALMVGLWGPYLFKEIRGGKADVRPRLPLGPSEPNPGRRDDPASGHPDGQGDPYETRAGR